MKEHLFLSKYLRMCQISLEEHATDWNQYYVCGEGVAERYGWERLLFHICPLCILNFLSVRVIKQPIQINDFQSKQFMQPLKVIVRKHI